MLDVTSTANQRHEQQLLVMLDVTSTANQDMSNSTSDAGRNEHH